MADNNKSHQQGMIDGIELWGTVCGKQGNCEGCPIGSIRGTNVTCQDFARQFPAKMLSILKEMNEGQLTYYEEYCMRFPECNLDLETLAAGTCRKMILKDIVAVIKQMTQQLAKLVGESNISVISLKSQKKMLQQLL